ncbi:hypothetical protein [Streptomyces sp. NPDC050704]|uniref:hypothetical protein n=1 Tax=Streptomyces sp. NPDC050704 TaxID=3157219 RepID=UPI003426594D
MSDKAATGEQRDDGFEDVYGEAPPLDEYRLSTRNDEHDFQYNDDHVQRCTRCRHPHSQWAGGPCPGSSQDWGPGRYV